MQIEDFPNQAVETLYNMGAGYKLEGFVLMSTDTANFYIIDRNGKTRMLVTSEWIELMEPTSVYKCVQVCTKNH